MIGKVIPRRRDGRSSFHAVTRYIAGVGHADKCTYVGSRNLQLADFPGLERPQDFIDLAASEMKSCAVQNARIGNPIMHVVMSWPFDEKPSQAQVDDAVEKLEKNFGLTGCQCIYGVHENTEHTHLHIAYNRVHPETYKAIKPANNWTKKELEKTVREIELAHGWAVELSGNHYTVQDGQVVSTKHVESQEIVASISESARDYETHTGEYSAQSKAIEKITPDLIKSANSWEEFHSKLKEVGATYLRKGSGAIIIIDEVEIKASGVSKKCTLTKLEKRFGTFQERKDKDIQNEIKTEPKTHPENSKEKYDIVKKNFLQTKRKLIAELSEKQHAEKRELQETQKNTRKNAFSGNWKGKGSELNFLRAMIAVKQARDKKELTVRHAKERKDLIANIGYFPSLREWTNGIGIEKPSNFVESASKFDAEQIGQMNHGIFGLEQVRVAGGAGFRKPGTICPIVVDTGRKIRTVASANEDAVLATLQLAQAKWGGCCVHGSPQYIALCLKVAAENGIRIANPELQTRLGVLKNEGRTAEETRDDRGGILRAHEDGQGRRYGRTREFGGSELANARRSGNGVETLEKSVMAVSEKIKEVRKQIVDDICNALEQGTGEWQKTWEVMQNRPENGVTGRPYNGGNALTLAFLAAKMGSDDPRWCTFNQANAKGWKIQKGAKGARISYFEIIEKDKNKLNPETDEIEAGKGKVVIAKQFVVFNGKHVEGMPSLSRPGLTPVEKIDKAERILLESGAKIDHGGTQAFYRPSEDRIGLPIRDSFVDGQFYYATALHELGHWTGHSSRLNRDLTGGFGSPTYAKEELVAELTSMFVGGETGLMPDQKHFDNHAAYIGHWISAMKKDPNELFRAAAAADKAANLVLVHEHERERQQKEQTQVQEGINLENPPGIEQEVKDLGLVRSAKVYTSLNETGNYKGVILHVNQEKGYSVQQVGKISLVIHNHENLERIPGNGENVRIAYQPGEKAKIIAIKQRQEREHSR